MGKRIVEKNAEPEKKSIPFFVAGGGGDI